MIHEYAIKVRGHEIDSFSHVNNAVYINYIEAARWDMFRTLFYQGKSFLQLMEELKLYAVVTETNIRYAREVKIFDEIVVKSKLSYSGNFLLADQKIYFKDTGIKAVAAKVTMILISSDTRTVQDLPDFMASQF